MCESECGLFLTVCRWYWTDVCTELRARKGSKHFPQRRLLPSFNLSETSSCCWAGTKHWGRNRNKQTKRNERQAKVGEGRKASIENRQRQKISTVFTGSWWHLNCREQARVNDWSRISWMASNTLLSGVWCHYICSVPVIIMSLLPISSFLWYLEEDKYIYVNIYWISNCFCKILLCILMPMQKIIWIWGIEEHRGKVKTCPLSVILFGLLFLSADIEQGEGKRNWDDRRYELMVRRALRCCLGLNWACRSTSLNLKQKEWFPLSPKTITDQWCSFNWGSSFLWQFPQSLYRQM